MVRCHRFLLREPPQVSILGCRDIGSQIAQSFGIGSMRIYLVLGEHKAPGPVTLAHWPDGFNKVVRQLDAIPPGDVFLVAAVVLDKVYSDPGLQL